MQKLKVNNERQKKPNVAYSEFIKQKEYEGLAVAKAKGVKLGRPKKKDLGVKKALSYTNKVNSLRNKSLNKLE